MTIAPCRPTLFGTKRIVSNPLRDWSRGVKKNSSQQTSTASGSKVLERLENRSLIRVSGVDSSDFLQGLVTNDMGRFEEGAASIYALFLNTKGRVLYESIIYKIHEESTRYIECDARIANDLQNHLNMYKIRRKVEVEPLKNGTSVWSAFDYSKICANAKNDDVKTREANSEDEIFACGASNDGSTKRVDGVAMYRDPRIPRFNFRILSSDRYAKEEIAETLGLDVETGTNLSKYREFRYRLGIAEGIDDLPVGRALPFDTNCDYLHGVSFRKGCYIGQESTARAYHTGVVRKRLMPLTLDGYEGKTLKYDENMVDEAGKIVGKFRGREGKFGMGLMRISEALNARTISLSDSCRVAVTKPRWWPKESRKDEAAAAAATAADE